MVWHAIFDLATGQLLETVASLEGVDLEGKEAVPILANRAPGEFQEVERDGSLRTDTARRDKIIKRARWARMDDAERCDLIDRVAALEAQVAALQAALPPGVSGTVAGGGPK